VALVGLIEGVAEATASITKLFSGWISDRLGKRKLLVLIGYGLATLTLATLTKPVFPLAVTPFEVMAARFADRIGKGIRGAPRDALIADITPNGGRGAAYGLRQSLDTVGAFVGPLIAMALMVVLAGDMRAVFGWAVVPAMIAVVLIIIGVEEPRGVPRSADGAPPIRLTDVRGLGRRFWGIVLLGVVFTLARFSEAFLILRAQGVGLPIALVGLPIALAPVVLVLMNVVYAGVAAPVGALSQDRIGRRSLLATGLVMLLAADLVLTLFGSVAGVLVGVALWGLHLGLTQGLLATLVADAAPAPLRATPLACSTWRPASRC